jgi:hypothetical protein
MTFVKGQSGNPSGRKKDDAPLMELRALAREYTSAAIDALVKALDNERTSVAAATALLDRGYGKPSQELTGPGGTGLLGDITIRLVKAEAKLESPPETDPGAWA